MQLQSFILEIKYFMSNPRPFIWLGKRALLLLQPFLYLYLPVFTNIYLVLTLLESSYLGLGFRCLLNVP